MSDTKSIQIYSNHLISNMIQEVNKTSIVSQEDANFLTKNTENFARILKDTYIWRTWNQKLSIISDSYHATLHSKFHQTILEQKVFIENTIRLASDAEKIKIEVEELQLDLEESQAKQSSLSEDSFDYKRETLKQKKINIDLKLKIFNYEEAKNAMFYRVKELKQWKEIQDQLYQEMKQNGLSDEEIWNKESGEIESQFFLFLNNLKGINNSSDGAEVANLIALAKHGIDQAMQAGIYQQLKSRCNKEQVAALQFMKDKIGMSGI